LRHNRTSIALDNTPENTLLVIQNINESSISGVCTAAYTSDCTFLQQIPPIIITLELPNNMKIESTQRKYQYNHANNLGYTLEISMNKFAEANTRKYY
jgi:hypothetical protein